MTPFHARFPPNAVALALAAVAILAPAGCATPSQPEADATAGARAPAHDCRPVTLRVDGLAIDTTDCRYATGHWRVQVEPALPGLALWRDRDRVGTVLQLFAKAPADAIASILPTLRALGHIPDDGDCRFVPAAARPWLPGPFVAYEIRPFGERLRRLEATPRDEVPDPPCGTMGWSTHGVRYFLADARRPDRVVYVDEGQDGTQVDPRTLRWDGGAK